MPLKRSLAIARKSSYSLPTIILKTASEKCNDKLQLQINHLLTYVLEGSSLETDMNSLTKLLNFV
ncbi:hypothetical protein C8E01_11754 [Pontibacter virosus]|uniref:Uncharacterized protein n=1 Tax=Pontibacter virosus TaxID=1765052 RepID=A0A2U1APL3_9BACT|nr:hypothetical protein C8E01_11754 [Pontibacter virosus]